MNGTILMELKSDACIGTGESASGIVDIEIQYDKYGIPYIPTKRIKGILREEAMELASLGQGATESDAKKLFGSPGDSDSGPLWMGNGEIVGKDSFVNKLLQKKESLDSKKKGYSDLLAPLAVKAMFTTVRAQTAINEEGVADMETLRISRVIRRGNIFRFPVKLKDGYNEKLFTDAVRCVRHIGSNRNRGLGWVSCTWEPGEEETVRDTAIDPPAALASSGAVALPYKIELLTDCVLDSQYIHGSTVLGMAASMFLQADTTINRATAHNDETFIGLFLDNTVYFGDAHPSDGIANVIPIPQSLANDKGSPKTLYNRFLDVDTDIQFEKPDFAFCAINYNEITPVRPQVAMRFHHKRASNTAVGSAKSTGSAVNADIEDNDGDFYQYDCIAAGTCYTGEITGPELHIELLRSLLSNKEVFIGKSRSAQYGHCRFTCGTPRDIQETALSSDFECEDHDIWPVMLLSDMLLYNINGQPDCTLEAFEKALAAAGVSGLSVIRDKSAISVTSADGFNTQWRMPKPVEPCFAKGSVFALDVSRLDAEGRASLYQSIQTMRLGQYSGSGLGRICIAPIIDEDEFIVITPDIAAPAYTATDSPLFDEKWKESLIMQANKAVKLKALTETENWAYFKKIEECLNECLKKSKSVVRFFMDSVRKAGSFEDIELSLGEYSDRQDGRGDIAEKEKLYKNIMEAIKPDGSRNLSDTAEKQIGHWIDSQQDTALKVWIQENIGESGHRVPKALFSFYQILLTQTCLRVLSDARRVKK